MFQHTALALAALGLFSGCSAREPADPLLSIPGPKKYQNEELGFRIHYPNVLDIRVSETGGADPSDIALSLEYPGNKHKVFRLTTSDPDMLGMAQAYLVPGSKITQPVGGESGSRWRVDDQSADEDEPGKTIQHVAVVKDGKLYLMTGRGDTFEKILESFEFVKDEPPAV